VDVLHLEAAHLALLEAIARGDGAVAAAPWRAATLHAAGAEEAAHGRIRGQRVAGQYDLEVVVVQLHGPARVLAVLRQQRRFGLRDKLGNGRHACGAVAERGQRGRARGVRRCTSAPASRRRSARPGR
jgi:hypothetical protein